jgi:hypothetical protein
MHFSPSGEFSPNDDGLAADVLRCILTAVVWTFQSCKRTSSFFQSFLLKKNSFCLYSFQLSLLVSEMKTVSDGRILWQTGHVACILDGGLWFVTLILPGVQIFYKNLVATSKLYSSSILRTHLRTFSRPSEPAPGIYAPLDISTKQRRKVDVTRFWIESIMRKK